MRLRASVRFVAFDVRLLTTEVKRLWPAPSVAREVETVLIAVVSVASAADGSSNSVEATASSRSISVNERSTVSAALAPTCTVTVPERSEARRVGKECVRTGRYRWAQVRYKNNNRKQHRKRG